jgi:spore coat protein H
MLLRRLSILTCAIGLLTLSAGVGAVPQRDPSSGLTADQLFTTDKIWTVRLTFTKANWDALTPVPAAAAPQAGPGFVGPEGMRNGLSAQRGLNFEYVHGSFDFDSHHFADVAVRFKGNGSYIPSQKNGKPPFKIDLNKYVKGQKLAGVTTLNLHNNLSDASMMNEVLAYGLYRDAGVPAPRTAYARVYVTAPGVYDNSYFGLYSVVEDIDSAFTESRFGVAGGALFKPVTPQLFEDKGRSWPAYNQMYDPKTDLTDAVKQRVFDMCELVSRADAATFTAKVGDFVDLPAFAKYMAVVAWLGNPDSLLVQGQNYYVYLHPKTQKMHFLPWDLDHSFGQFVPFVPTELQQQLNIMHPWNLAPDGMMGPPPMHNRFLERVFAVDAFKRPYLAAMADLNKTLGDPARIGKQLDDLGAVLAPVVADEVAPIRASTFKEVFGEATFKRPINQNVTVVPVKVFVRIRQASVSEQLKTLGMN